VADDHGNVTMTRRRRRGNSETRERRTGLGNAQRSQPSERYGNRPSTNRPRAKTEARRMSARDEGTSGGSRRRPTERRAPARQRTHRQQVDPRTAAPHAGTASDEGDEGDRAHRERTGQHDGSGCGNRITRETKATERAEHASAHTATGRGHRVTRVPKVPELTVNLTAHVTQRTDTAGGRHERPAKPGASVPGTRRTRAGSERAKRTGSDGAAGATLLRYVPGSSPTASEDEVRPP
jgi:hypothetical protein